MITTHSVQESIDLAKEGTESMTKCPSHDDGNASLHIAPGHSQPVVMTCHAQCDRLAILEAAGIDPDDLMAPRDENDFGTDRDMWTPAGTASHRYPYYDEEGALLYEVLRIPLPGGDKTFRQRKPNENRPGRWEFKLGDTRRVLYRLPEVIEAVKEGNGIYLVEGEKDVDNLMALGYAATTSPMGAGKWKDEFSQVLAGATVRIIADKDDTGRGHARTVKASLESHGCSVSLWEAAGEHKDVSDHLAANLSMDELLETSPEHAPEKLKSGVDVVSAIQRQFADSTFVIPGTLAEGERVTITGFEGGGKALALDTELAVPGGFCTMGDIEVGDPIYAANGAITTVVAKSDVMLDKDCYEVEFSDGSVIVAAGDHLWETETRKSREATARYSKKSTTVKPRGVDQKHKRKHFPQVITTREIRDTLRNDDGSANHSVAMPGPLAGVPVELPVDPYTLGAWLGDGTSLDASITSHPDDVEVLERITSAGWVVNKRSGKYRWGIGSGKKWNGSLQSKLRSMGVLGNKHIPDEYLNAPADDRLALVQGLMDTDGTISESGKAEYCSTSETLASGMLWLLRSLGVKVNSKVSNATLEGRVVGLRYRLTFTTDVPVFHLGRKAERISTRTTARHKLRYIVDVREVDPVPVQCIQVADESHMYLVGPTLIPTHNSMLLRQLAVQVAAGIHPFTGRHAPPKKVLYIDSENHPRQVLESWQQLVGLAAHHGSPIEPDHLYILEEWETQPMITTQEGKDWLTERIHAYKPDLICMGPLYVMSDRDLSKEEPVGTLIRTVNQARGLYGTSFIMEHHAPHRAPGDPKRSVRPYGHSTLMRWPDFGFGLQPVDDQEGVFEWAKTRGMRVRDRVWPDFIRWGKKNTSEWPWTCAYEQADGTIQ